MIARSPNLRVLYDDEAKAELDRFSALKGAREEGVAIGEARGVAIGEARGVAIGEARGRVAGRAEGEALGRSAGLAEGEAVGRTAGVLIGRITFLEEVLGLPLTPESELADRSLPELRAIAADLHERFRKG